MKDKTKWMSRVYLILVIFTFGIVWQICSDKGLYFPSYKNYTLCNFCRTGIWNSTGKFDGVSCWK